MKLEGRDRVVAMDVAGPDGLLLIVSQKGYGKQSELRHYRQQGRGGKGLITLMITRKNGRIAAAQVVNDETELYLLTERAMVQEIRLDEIRTTYRNTQGVIVMKLESGDRVSAIRALGSRRTPAKTLSLEHMAAEAGELNGDEEAETNGDLDPAEAEGNGAGGPAQDLLRPDGEPGEPPEEA